MQRVPPEREAAVEARLVCEDGAAEDDGVRQVGAARAQHALAHGQPLHVQRVRVAHQRLHLLPTGITILLVTF